MRAIAAVSGVYDALVGIAMLAARPLLAQLFGVPLPQPPIHADLNGLFLLAVAGGYLIPYRDPARGPDGPISGSMDVLLKGAGATLFLVDHYLRQSPASFLLFGASDGALALITLWALLLE